MGILRQLFGPSKDEVWAQLAREIGANFDEGGLWRGSKVTAHVKEWTVTLDTYTVSTGKSTVTYTRMRAPYVNRDGFRFKLYRRGFFTSLGKKLGMQDIDIGDPEFDEDYVIQSNEPEKARRLFANPCIRALVQAQPDITLEVKDDEGWFRKSFPEGVDELYFHVVGVIKDLDQLKALFELYAATLDELCRIGSAYEQDPGVRL